MRLTWLHAKTATLELLRYRSFSVPTLLFPTVAFLVFGRRIHAPANVLMSYYAAFAVLGVAFYQFGVGIAAERVLPWYALVRVLPVSATARFAARIMSALAFALASASLVVLVALVTTSVELDARAWVRFGTVIALGSVPFALFGIALGYWLSPKGALPVANLLFLGLSYAGGLLGGSAGLPDAVRGISGYLPTRLWGNLLGAAVDAGSWHARDAVGLAAYAVAFAVAASVGYRRDEGERFH
jgi:ABC-2 type transport system permease protein